MPMVRITHPFHPLYQQVFPVVTRRQNWCAERVYFYYPEATLTSVPLAWTDLAPLDPFIVQAAGLVPVRLVDLLGLVEVVRQRKPTRPSKKRRRPT